MHNIEYAITPISGAKEAILLSLKNYFLKGMADDFIDYQITEDIEKYLFPFKENLYCLIEYPYVDKVYRDSFYNYYSSKHYTYHRDCIRVSIFSSKISAKDFFVENGHKSLRKKYLGFFIIRPLSTALLGRSVINPKAYTVNRFNICSYTVESLVIGVKLSTEGFPHSSQDGETISCAETTIWTLMEYFGNKYSEYKPALPKAIINAIAKFSYQRYLPSNGLTMHQISYVLHEFGFGTRFYSDDENGIKDLYNIIDSYVESGIPIIAGLEVTNECLGHVMVVMGKKRQNRKQINWTRIKKDQFTARGRTVCYYDATNIPAKYVIQDDNLEPYRVVKLSKPGEHYSDDDRKKYHIDGVIVPLYPKMYLEAVVAKELILELIKYNIIGYDFKDEFVFRFFLTSSRSLKNHIASINEMDILLKYNIVSSKMPKFVWCGEFYTTDGYANGQAIGLVIVDATEANQRSQDALIFAGYPDRCIRKNENNFVTLPEGFSGYIYYDNLN
jgi:hypothetical protein